MKKIRKIALRLSVVALSFIVVLSFLSSTVQATGYYVVNCMIAHDEEWDTNAFWYYGYSGEELASIIFYEAGYYFGWHFDILFRIRAWRSWNSYDDFPTTEYFRDEVISETGFTQGMIINDVEIHLLIAFTDETFQDC